MVLRTQFAGGHNRILGQEPRESQTAKFSLSFDTRPAKRLKRDHSVTSSRSRDGSEQEGAGNITIVDREIHNSDATSEDEDKKFVSSTRKTELESSLPPVKTDEEAIADYEATRAAEVAAELDLQGRFGQRKWIQGKSSIYVDAFNLALRTVLEDEAHLFDEAETAVFDAWRTLSYEAQYLWVANFSVA